MNGNYFARVRPWSGGAVQTGLPTTEVCGVTRVDRTRRIPKVKVNGCWLDFENMECKFYEITEEEFETDLSFGLWPQLKIKYCSRLWWWLKNINWEIWLTKSRKFNQHDLFPWFLVALTAIAFVVELAILSGAFK